MTFSLIKQILFSRILIRFIEASWVTIHIRVRMRFCSVIRAQFCGEPLGPIQVFGCKSKSWSRNRYWIWIRIITFESR